MLHRQSSGDTVYSSVPLASQYVTLASVLGGPGEGNRGVPGKIQKGHIPTEGVWVSEFVFFFKGGFSNYFFGG